MKTIDINKINLYKKFVTRNHMVAKLLSHVPETASNQRLIFLVSGNIVTTNEEGKCTTVNSKGPEYFDTNYSSFDVFYDDIEEGWVNMKKSVDKDGKPVYTVSSVIHPDIETAKKHVENDHFKTIRIEWSIE
jgi:hypothetical protein